MLFHKQVKAGVLLYALLMTAVFSLLLQFYVHEVLANGREQVALKETAQAQLMADLTRQTVNGESGENQYNLGQTYYQVQGDKLVVAVTLKNGKKREFRYVYSSSSSSSSDVEATSSSSTQTSLPSSDTKETQTEKIERSGVGDEEKRSVQ